MYDNDKVLENFPEYAFDLLDAAQRLLHKLDGISTTDFSNGGDESERKALRKVVEQITGTAEFVTRLSSEQYAARKGNYCPRCLSMMLAASAFAPPENGVTEREIRCRSCAANWMELYRVEGYRDLLS